MRTSWMAAAALVFASCGTEEPTWKTTSWEIYRPHFPTAGADVLTFDLIQYERIAEDPPRTRQTTHISPKPIVVDADGVQVEFERFEWVDANYAWEPVVPMAPGVYTIVGAEVRDPRTDEVTAAELEQPMTIGPWGDGALDGSRLVGRAWEITDTWSGPDDFVFLAFDLVGTGVLRIDAVEGDQVTFSVIGRSVEGVDCLALRDVGRLEGSTLVWGVERADIDTEEGLVTFYDMGLEAYFDPAALGNIRARAYGILDGSTVDPFMDGSGENAICRGGAALGAPCRECPDEGPRHCIGTQLHDVHGAATDVLSDLPTCGVDRVRQGMPDWELETPSLACQVDDVDIKVTGCACGQVGRQAGAPLVLLALMVGFRRRRD